VDGI
jgi:hypothetical protein